MKTWQEIKKEAQSSMSEKFDNIADDAAEIADPVSKIDIKDKLITRHLTPLYLMKNDSLHGPLSRDKLYGLMDKGLVSQEIKTKGEGAGKVEYVEWIGKTEADSVRFKIVLAQQNSLNMLLDNFIKLLNQDEHKAFDWLYSLVKSGKISAKEYHEFMWNAMSTESQPDESPLSKEEADALTSPVEKSEEEMAEDKEGLKKHVDFIEHLINRPVMSWQQIKEEAKRLVKQGQQDMKDVFREQHIDIQKEMSDSLSVEQIDQIAKKLQQAMLGKMSGMDPKKAEEVVKEFKDSLMSFKV